jgi:exopolysaccharide biosynthesis WecB/TagA/CpsF family protein
MIDQGRHRVIAAGVDAVDYEAAVTRILGAAREGRGYSVSALAIHGVMTTVFNRDQRVRVAGLDLVTPDGQGVRWALNLLHGTLLADRVYGPRLMLEVCRVCAAEDRSIFLYGSTASTLDRLAANLRDRVPGLLVAGSEPSQFGTPGEQREIAARITTSGASVTFVGLGCPRQEVFCFEYRGLIPMPCLAVGAAFDYHAGTLREPPVWVQRYGLHGLFRAAQEPARLWKRFLLLPPTFCALVAAQRLGLGRFVTPDVEPPPIRHA